MKFLVWVVIILVGSFAAWPLPVERYALVMTALCAAHIAGALL